MSETLLRRRFLRHPSWGWRLARSRVQWWAAGRPPASPLPGEGFLLACPHGHGTIMGWLIHREAGPTTRDALWDALSARHPVERVPYLHHCDACREEDQ